MPAIDPDRETVGVERDDRGFVLLSLRVPGYRHTVLTPRMLEDLAAAMEMLDAGRTPGVILLSAVPGCFCAGLDPAFLEGIRDRSADDIVRFCDRGKAALARLSRGVPTAAVIDGGCLDGGLELALACDLRVATTSRLTRLGLPGVGLGLPPCLGGTVRLPRLIGPAAAIELAVSGRLLDGPRALPRGLVDACVDGDDAIETARRLLTRHAGDGLVAARRRRFAIPVPEGPGEAAAREAAAEAVRDRLHRPVPAAILRTIDAAAAGVVEAMRMESEAFAAAAATPEAGHLLRARGLVERNRRDEGIDAGIRGGPVPEAAAPAVVGAGIMGSGIAAGHLRTGFAVTLVDSSPAALAAAVPGLLEEAAWDRVAERPDPGLVPELASRLRTGTSLAAIAGADIVMESVTERPDLKRHALAEIERVVGPATVITTNTSTNPIGRLAAGLTDPARFCGLHFFNPVARMRLVEVVRGPATTDATVAFAVAHAKRLGKYPVVVTDSPGFLVNRILMPYLHEAGEMLREGVPADRIDRLAREFGMPLGPIELYDVVGLDTAFYAGLVLTAVFGDRIEPSPVIPALVKSGSLGRKAGTGFYSYSEPGPGGRILGPAPDAAGAILRYRRPDRSSCDRTVVDRLFLPMLLEALRALDERLVRDARDVDLAVIHALGFPAFRGGLLAWGDSLGAAEVIRRLERLADLGPRMRPTDRLLEHASTGRPFAP